MRTYREDQKRAVVHSLLSGKYVDGFPNPREQAVVALAEIKRIASDSLPALVTHDWWMSLFLANLTDAFLRDDYGIWPEYLESFSLDFTSQTIHYRGDCLPLR